MAKNQISIEQFIGFEKKKLAGSKSKIQIGKILSFIILLAFCVIWLMPFAILLFGAMRGYYDNTFYPDRLFNPPSGWTLENFEIILLGKYPETMTGSHNTIQDVKIFRWTLNTCFSAIGGTLLYLLVASFAAYAFTFIDFKYRNVLFAILVGSMVIPGTATAVGNQTVVFSTGLNNSLLALIIPGLGGVYGMYLIKTFFTSIPKELIESAKMDGYSNLQIYFKIVLPLGKTVLFVQGLFGFMGGWNDLVWPKMLFGTKDTDLWTLQVGISYIINNTKSTDLIGASLASGVLCVLPVLVVFLIAQDTIIEGMASAGVKM